MCAPPTPSYSVLSSFCSDTRLLVACCSVLAAKSILERLGMDATNEQENSAGRQQLAQPRELQPCATVNALPLEGNLRPDALLPVVVHTRLIAGATCMTPHVERGRDLANHMHAQLLNGRGGP